MCSWFKCVVLKKNFHMKINISKVKKDKINENKKDPYLKA